MAGKLVSWSLLVLLAGMMGGTLIWGIKNHNFQGGVLAVTTTKSTEERLAALERRVTSLERSAAKTGTATTYSEKFIALSDVSTVGSDQWTKIEGSEFSLDLSLYGTVKEVTWQGWNEMGLGSFRIYDATNHRAVDNSEVSASDGSRSSFYTKPLSIWRGTNQYYLQAKGSGSFYLTSLKLRILSK